MIEIMLIGGLAVLVALCVGDLISPYPRGSTNAPEQPWQTFLFTI
jgi:hypothetical protein